VDTYQPGKSNRHTLETYFLPYQQAFEYCGMNWKGLAASQVPSAAPVEQAAKLHFNKTIELF